MPHLSLKTSLTLWLFALIAALTYAWLAPDYDMLFALFWYRLHFSLPESYDLFLGILRRLNFGLTYGIVAACVGSMIYRYFWIKRRRFRDYRKSLFVLLSFTLGAAVICDSLVKELFSRSRPGKVIATLETYNPPLTIGQDCQTNCAFVSGEVASATAFLSVLVFLRRQRWMAFSGIMLWIVVVSWIRMAQMGHYLSDTVFAMLITWGVMDLLRWAMNLRPSSEETS